MRKGSTKLELVASPQDFFREMVVTAKSEVDVALNDEVEFYLVDLLSKFVSTDNLFPQNENGTPVEQPLAFQIKDALEAQAEEQQRLMFRQLGDFSLYTAGFFQDSLFRKSVDVDYYIDMGRVAYRNVASRWSESRQLFEGLSELFPSCVSVLSEVSEKTTPRREEALLQAYERWMRTGSAQSAKVLRNAGIILPPRGKVGNDVQ